MYSGITKPRFVCIHGHVHRTERGAQYCHVETEWLRKRERALRTGWRQDGTCTEWFDVGPYREWFWKNYMVTTILWRDNHRCQYAGCTKTTDLEVHHILPRRLGGTDHPWNLLTLCSEHHGMQPVHHHDPCLCLSDATLQCERARLAA